MLALLVLALVTAAAPGSGLPLRGEAAERFLREATVVARKPIGVGVTLPEKLTLSDGNETHHAVWKTIDELRYETTRGPRGAIQLTASDSYRYEVAAYELDKLLDLGIVPPTVERVIDGKRGSLQLWVEGAITELDRRKKGLEAEDVLAWSDALSRLRLFKQLIYDSDAANLQNVLYDAAFHVYAIDHSRAFLTFPRLPREEALVRFPRSVITALESLTRERLDETLRAWLSPDEIEGLFSRRDEMLDRVRALVLRLGAETVLYP